MYSPHPSPELQQAFAAKPYQGTSPERATFLFVGLDANYAPDIAQSRVFSRVLEYHEDAVSFWQRHGVHHPFLLPEYSGDGQFYHRSFARIGFRPEHAPFVSFVELLHVPTVGRNRIEAQDLMPAHLDRISAAIIDGNPRYIFLPSGVARLMRESKRFRWLPGHSSPERSVLKTLVRLGDKTVYSHLHFSVYGKFEVQKVAEARAIAELIASIQ